VYGDLVIPRIAFSQPQREYTDLLFVTRDGKILEYGAAGHLRVMVC
jgi:hypothetical protein